MFGGLAARLNHRLLRLRATGLYRERLRRDGSPGRTSVSRQPLHNFAGNDYLGLAEDTRVVQAFQRAADRYGVGAGASGLISGYTEAHEELEQALARFTGRERALVFSSGYSANMSVISVFASRGTVVLEDRLNHASLIDAATLARARLLRYAHADAEALDARLHAVAQGDALVVTDGVFSMEGDLAPLPALAEACARHGAALMVDDAHGIGVLGAKGAGSLEHHDLDPAAVPVLVGTFGKALGVCGAFMAGDAVLVEALIQFARPYIYSTALPPAIACAVSESLHIVVTEPERRARLRARIHYFRERARQRGLPLNPSVTPIQVLIVGDNRRVVDIARCLREDSLLVAAIRPPTVSPTTARLRISLSATHSEGAIDRLVDRMAALV